MVDLAAEIRAYRNNEAGQAIPGQTAVRRELILGVAKSELKAVQTYWGFGEVDRSKRGLALSYQYEVPESAGPDASESTIGTFPLGGRYYRSYAESILEVGLYGHTKIGRQGGYVCVRADRFNLRPNSDYSRYSHRGNIFCPNDWMEMVRDRRNDDGKCFPADIDTEELLQAMHARIIRVLATDQSPPQKLRDEALKEIEELKRKGLLFNTKAECVKAAMKDELARREAQQSRSPIARFLFPR